jgi:nucleoside-diphosphate-sugar epimerase
MVTGGTGFIGAHTTKALLDAGHDVTLLVRTAERIDENLKPLGVDEVAYVVGDMLDEDSVLRAMDGCDAVVHAGAVVSLSRNRAAEVLDANPRGAQIVIDAAIGRRLDPIVYVSSASALFTPGVPTLHAELPIADAASAYGRSKALAEAHARRRQQEGAPVTITYPGAVVGPAAGTALGEAAPSIVLEFRFGLLPVRDAAWSVLDVRDLAAIHRAAMHPGRGPRRYMCGGRFMTIDELAAIYRELTGRRFPVVPIPAPAMRGLGRVMDVVTRLVPVESVFTEEGMVYLTRWVPTDDAAVTDDLGVVLRDPHDTLADAILSLYRAGKLSARDIGALAP